MASPRAASTPARWVPPVVRVASKVRGKAKCLESIAAACALLAAAEPNTNNKQRATDALARKRAFELELEDLAARLEAAIQLCNT